MYRTTKSICALFAIMSLWYASPVAAQDVAADVSADGVVERCLDQVRDIADRCVDANRRTARRSVEAIEELLEQGRPRAARDLAHHSMEKIDRRSNRSVNKIKKIRNHCVRILKKLGADELAEHVRKVSNRQILKVRVSQRIAKEAIGDALDG